MDNGDYGTINGVKSYAKSKLMNLLFAKELADRVSKQGYNFTIMAVHPGMSPTNMVPELFQTDMWKYIYSLTMGIIFKTPEHAAQAAISAATEPELQGVMGAYYGQCGILDTPHPQVLNTTVRKILWKESTKLLNIDEDFVAMMTGQANAQSLFSKGKLKMKGNMGLAMKLSKLTAAKAKL